MNVNYLYIILIIIKLALHIRLKLPKQLLFVGLANNLMCMGAGRQSPSEEGLGMLDFNMLDSLFPCLTVAYSVLPMDINMHTQSIHVYL